MTQYAHPDEPISNGGWSVTGAATTWEATDEGIDDPGKPGPDDNTTRCNCTANGGISFTVGLENVQRPALLSDVAKLGFRASERIAGGPSSGTFNMVLLEGSTIIAQQATGFGAYATQYLTLSLAQKQSIGDWSNLRARLTYNRAQSNTGLCSTIEFQCGDPPPAEGAGLMGHAV